MVSQIETIILKLQGLGFFEFILPFFLTAAIFYGLLRKSQVFGKPEENIAVNAIVALVAGFMVWAYPILAGVPVEKILSEFFFKGTIVILIVLLGVLVGGMFLPPDLPAEVAKVIKGGKGIGVVIVGGLLIVIIAALSAGIDRLLFPSGFGFGTGGVGFGGIDQTTLLSGITIIAMAAAVIGIVWGGGGGKK